MNALNETDRCVRAQCREWLTLLESGEASDSDRERFEAWLQADDSHQRAYARLRGLWQDVGTLRHLADLEPVPPHQTPLSTESARTHSTRRWRALPWAAAAAIAAITVLISWQQSQTTAPATVAEATFVAEYASGLGEVRTVALPDGSVVTMAPLTQARVQIAQGERRVQLERGEAYFAVAKDPVRPFHVEANNATVRVVGTQFDVRVANRYVRITVAEGRVMVNDRQDPLTSGQRIDVLPNGTLSGFATDANTAIGAWREGRLVYENATLADVISDLSRYRSDIALAPEASDLRVTAGLHVDQIDAFVDGLPHILPVRVERHGAAVVIDAVD